MGIKINPEDLNRAIHPSGEDVPHFRPSGTQPITLELPVWVIDELENTAQKLKVTKDDLVKVWLGEHFIRRH